MAHLYTGARGVRKGTPMPEPQIVKTGFAPLDKFVGGLPSGVVTNVSFSDECWQKMPGLFIERVGNAHVIKYPSPLVAIRTVRAPPKPIIIFDGFVTDAPLMSRLAQVARETRTALLIFSRTVLDTKPVAFHAWLRVMVQRNGEYVTMTCVHNAVSAESHRMTIRLDANLDEAR